MANNAVAVQKIEMFKGILNSQTIRAQLKNSLKDNAGAFMSSMIDLYSGDTYLQNCDPEKVALEWIKAAALKLPISKALGFAYVVPYDGKPTFTIGYKGLIQLAMRTGQYRTINADVVYEGEFERGDKLTGEIKLDGEKVSDKIIGYFCYIELINGFSKTLYMTKEQVDAWAKKYSPSVKKGSFSPWVSEFDKMAQKTVIRRLISTYGAMSMEMQNVLDEDEDNEAKIRRDIGSNANIIEIDATELKKETAEIAENVQAEETIPNPGF